MKVVLNEPKYFKDSVMIISELVSETNFEFSEKGLEIIALDPANVAMVIFNLFPSDFGDYDVKQKEKMGLSLPKLKQVLRRMKTNDKIIMEIVESKLKIQLKGNNTRTFYIPIIEVEEKEQKIPNFDFKVNISMDSKQFSEAVSDVDIVGESVSLITESDKFSVMAEGDLSKANIEMKKDDNLMMEAPVDKIKAKYSIEYLKKMVSGEKIADKVSISFSPDYPLKLSYSIIDKVKIDFILAPRVDND